MYDLQTLLNDFNANRKAAELATSRTFPRGPIKKRQNGSSRAARGGLASKPALPGARHRPAQSGQATEIRPVMLGETGRNSPPSLAAAASLGRRPAT